MLHLYWDTVHIEHISINSWGPGTILHKLILHSVLCLHSSNLCPSCLIQDGVYRCSKAYTDLKFRTTDWLKLREARPNSTLQPANLVMGEAGQKKVLFQFNQRTTTRLYYFVILKQQLAIFFSAATSWPHALTCKQKEKHWPRTEHFQSCSSEDKWALPVSVAPALVHCSTVLFCSPFPGISFPFHFGSSMDYTPPQIIYYSASHSPGPYWDQGTVWLCVWGDIELPLMKEPNLYQLIWCE